METDKFAENKRADAQKYQAIAVQHRGASEVLARLSQIIPAKLRARLEGKDADAELLETWDKVLGKEDGDALKALRRMLEDLIGGVGKELFREAGAQSRLSDEKIGQAKEALKIASELEAMAKQAVDQPPDASDDEVQDAGGDAGK